MFLIVSQVIVLLAANSSINQLPESGPVDPPAITLEDLESVDTDLKKANADLINTIKNLNSKDEPEEKPLVNTQSEKTAVPADVVPATVKHDNQIEKTQQTTSVNKQKTTSPVAPIERNPAVSSQSFSSDNKAVQTEDKSGDAIMAVSDIKSVDEVNIVSDIRPAFIKYDSNGELIEDDNEHWACVHDTRNGLMWEVKSKDVAMRNPENLYSWYNPEHKILKGVTDGGRCKGDIECDTNAYIEAMNKQRFCGYNDWRLPTREEMLGLVSYEDGSSTVKINTSLFPETLPSWYWTASTNESRPEFAWYVLFKNGIFLNDLKENPKHIRLVRSESSS
jgi:hypothetical protein